MPTEIAFITPSRDALDTVAPSSVETITATASNQVSTNGAKSGETCVVTTTVDTYVSFGASPNATSDSLRRLVTAGSTRAFSGLGVNHKAAVVTA